MNLIVVMKLMTSESRKAFFHVRPSAAEIRLDRDIIVPQRHLFSRNCPNILVKAATDSHIDIEEDKSEKVDRECSESHISP